MRFALMTVVLLLSACTALQPSTCADGQEPAMQDFLYLGTNKPQGIVSAEEWGAFLADTVTPRFPEGFTVWPASGQWQSAAGAIEQEASYVLSIVHPAAADTLVQELVTEYMRRFQQEAVLRVRSPVCISFQ